MTPTADFFPFRFPQCNVRFGPPPDYDESQVFTIDAHRDTIVGGNIDGSELITVAWKPSPDALAALNAGAPVFLTMVGCLAPHMLNTSFEAVWPNAER